MNITSISRFTTVGTVSESKVLPLLYKNGIFMKAHVIDAKSSEVCPQNISALVCNWLTVELQIENLFRVLTNKSVHYCSALPLYANSYKISEHVQFLLQLLSDGMYFTAISFSFPERFHSIRWHSIFTLSPPAGEGLQHHTFQYHVQLLPLLFPPILTCLLVPLMTPFFFFTETTPLFQIKNQLVQQFLFPLPSLEFCTFLFN